MKRKSNKSIILRLLVLAVCVYFIIGLVDLYSELKTTQAKRDEYLLIESQKKNDIEELNVILNSDSNKELIEKAARERLGYIYPNEEIYIDVSGN